MNINLSGKYNPTTTIWSDMSSIPQEHHGVWWLPTGAYLHRLNSSYILNAKWFHPAARNVIHMWMAFLTQIYSRIRLLAPGVLNNIEAEQIKKKRKKGRQREKSLLTAAFSVLLCVVKMLPSELYQDNWPIVLLVIKDHSWKHWATWPKGAFLYFSNKQSAAKLHRKSGKTQWCDYPNFIMLSYIQKE